MNKYLKKLLPFYQKMGVNLIPNHYEEPIPDLAELRSFDWKKESEMAGIDLRPAAQIKLLDKVARYFGEFKELPAKKTGPPEVEEYHHSNPSFRAVDAGFYYGLLRHLKPKRVIEIGSGFSTLLAAQALLLNAKEGEKCDMTAIEPYPSATLRGGIPGLTRLIEGKVQGVPLKEFEALGANDILFIDSSHVLTIGSDVQYEFLEILPRLKKGIWVHVHDIYFPMEYPEKVMLEDFKFYNEQYLLQAFLAFNPRFEVVWAGHYMYMKHRDLLEKRFGGDPGPSIKNVSFWMRRR